MKAATTLPLMISLLMAPAIWGQHEDASMFTELLASKARSLSVGTIHYDLVNADYAPTLDEKNALLRITSRERDGWAVRVLSPDGALMMTGLYADEQLNVPNGRFTYFYINGQVESSGIFQDGQKRGVWLRYTPWGSVLAERVYAGIDNEGMPIREGWGGTASAN